MIRIVSSVVLVILGVSSAFAQDAQVEKLQDLLNNAGFNVGAADGGWGRKTREGLEAFARQYGLSFDTGDKPDDAELAAILDDATAALDKDFAAYPSQALPNDFFLGAMSGWYFSIQQWDASVAVAKVGDDVVNVRKSRFGEPLPVDLQTFREAGVRVIRLSVAVEGAIFWRECDFTADMPKEQASECYSNSFESARKEGWAAQTAALPVFGENPVIKLYLDAIEEYNQAGFHVIVVPHNFVVGRADWAGVEEGPLTDVYYERDEGFRPYYASWIGALIAEVRKRGLDNVSLQSSNEPKFCEGRVSSPNYKGLADWRNLEREIFDRVRRVAPKISLISSAICTAGDQFFTDMGRPYSEARYVIPLHQELNDVTYAIHFRNPRLLFLGDVEYPLEPDTMVQYPYERLAETAGERDFSRFQIQRYNETKPARDVFDGFFEQLEAFGSAHNVRLMITEFDMIKPAFGVERSDRIAAVLDVLGAAKDHDIAVIWGGLFDQNGLSSCPPDPTIPDHRWDDRLLETFAAANGTPHDFEEIDCDVKPTVTIDPIASYRVSVPALSFDFDGAVCSFKMEAGATASGTFFVSRGRLNFVDVHWVDGVSSARLFKDAFVAMTAQNQLIGRLPFRTPDGAEAVAELKSSTSDFSADVPTGSARFMVGESEGTFEVTSCVGPPPDPNAFNFAAYDIASEYDGMACTYSLDRTEGADKAPLSSGRVRLVDGRVQLGGAWDRDLSAPVGSIKESELAFTKEGDLVGRMDVYYYYVGTGQDPRAPVEVTLTGGETKPGNGGRPNSVTTFKIDHALQGVLTIEGCS